MVDLFSVPYMLINLFQQFSFFNFGKLLQYTLNKNNYFRTKTLLLEDFQNLILKIMSRIICVILVGHQLYLVWFIMRLDYNSDMHYVSLCWHDPKHGIFIRINNVQLETFQVFFFSQGTAINWIIPYYLVRKWFEVYSY